MVDVVDQATRSRMMSSIHAKNTKPEIVLRRKLHRAGLRYRLHNTKLAGKPDLVLASRRAVIFVHGCFWHRHNDCHWCSTPSSNTEFWSAKFERNKKRDAKAVETLRAEGWRVAIVWECGLRTTSLEETSARLLTWIRCESGDFETELVRARG